MSEREPEGVTSKTVLSHVEAVKNGLAPAWEALLNLSGLLKASESQGARSLLRARLLPLLDRALARARELNDLLDEIEGTMPGGEHEGT